MVVLDKQRDRGERMRTRVRMSKLLYHYYTTIAPRPNIWGRVTDGPLFASHHSNVLPAPAPMSINGRHVPKHIQHTKRTLWLEEMDCARDWQGTLWMCQSPKPLCFTPLPSIKNKDHSFFLFLFFFIFCSAFFVDDIYTWISYFLALTLREQVYCKHKRLRWQKKKKSVMLQICSRDEIWGLQQPQKHNTTASHWDSKCLAFCSI